MENAISSDMPNYSDDPNFLSSERFRIKANALTKRCSYHPNMARKRNQTRVPGPDWYLPEWMDSLGVKQSKLSSLTDWSPSTVNDIYHGRTEYYREIVNLLAAALNIEPFELLMHPEDAMALRRLRETALSIAADNHSEFRHEPQKRTATR